MENISEKIFKLRKKFGLSQEELGFEIGVSRQTVSKWELGTVVPEFKNLRALSEFFKVDINYFVLEAEREEISLIKLDIEQEVNKKDVKANHKNTKHATLLKILIFCASLITVALVLFLIIALLNLYLTPEYTRVENIIIADLDFSIYDILIFCIIGIAVFVALIILLIIIIVKRKK